MTRKKQFEGYITQNLDKIFRFAYSQMGNTTDAEDVVNDSVIKALKALPDLDHPDYMATWFYRIVANTAKTALMKRGKVVAFDPTDDAFNQLVDTSPGLEGPKALEFDDLVAVLDPQSRSIVVLRYFEDLPLSDIAPDADYEKVLANYITDIMRQQIDAGEHMYWLDDEGMMPDPLINDKTATL